MKCARLDCERSSSAFYQVAFHLPAKGDAGGKGRELEGEIGLIVCGDCRAKVEADGADELFAPAGREKIAEAVRGALPGAAEPDFDRARFSFREVV